MRGSIRQRTPGSWQLLYYVDGKQKSKTIVGTKRDAERILTEIVRSISQGCYEEKPKKVVTVGMVLEEWLEDAKGRVAVTSYSRYKISVSKWLMKEFGGFALSALGPREIDSVYKSWVRNGMAPRTVKSMHNTLSSALRYAVDRELVSRNAASLVKPPSPARSPRGTLTDEQVSRLLHCSEDMPYGKQAMLAVLTGMRLGEICALKWGSIDFPKRELVVRNSAAWIEGKLVIKCPKTHSSERTICLSPRAVELLETIPRAGEYVFGGDTPLAPPTVSNGVARLCRGLGYVETTMHGLRHTHASMLFRRGVSPKIVQERLGHSSFSETMDTYTHLLPHQQRDAAMLVDDLPQYE